MTCGGYSPRSLQQTRAQNRANGGDPLATVGDMDNLTPHTTDNLAERAERVNAVSASSPIEYVGICASVSLIMMMGFLLAQGEPVPVALMVVMGAIMSMGAIKVVRIRLAERRYGVSAREASGIVLDPDGTTQQ